MAITPQQARVELARRELARRGVLNTPSVQAPHRKPSWSERLVEHTPDIYQIAGNIAGLPVGAALSVPTGGIVNPASASAFGGASMRALGSIGQDIGRYKTPDISKAGREFQSGLYGEFIGHGLGRVIEKTGRTALPAAKRLILSYLKPSGQFAEKGPQIAETILKEGLARGSQRKMLETALSRAAQARKEVDDIISRYSHKRVTAKQALSYLDVLEQKYLRGQADPASAEIVRKTKQRFIESYRLKEPILGKVERGQFVMGGMGKLTKPQKFVYERGESTGFILKGPGKLTKPQKFVYEGKSDILGVPIRERTAKILPVESYPGVGPVESRTADVTRTAKILPVESYQRRPTTLGVPRRVEEVVGEKYRKFGLTEAQRQKRGQYQNISGKYGVEKISAEDEARKQFARGIKEAIEKKIPHEPVALKNKRLGDLIEAVEAISERLPVSERANIFGLIDSIMAGASFVNPAALKGLLGRKFLGTETIKNVLARKLYETSLKAPGRAAMASSPLAKAYISRILSGNSER